MTNYNKNLPSVKKILFLSLLPIIVLLIIISCEIFLRKNKEAFPVNIPCRGNMIIEAQYDNERARMVTSLYFSFLGKNKILISLSGTGYLYNNKNVVIEKKTLLRNIYYDSVQESKATETYSLTSSQINIDSVDDFDWRISSLLLMNSFFLTGHTDTLVLKKFGDNALLIGNNQSPFTLCVFNTSL
ncbi:hypothetical protein [Rahnella sp. PCH160]|uniref:hypothetical protein n=1 Tax=Rahnella sp. PCH160 TaxID=3447928 RepID=UPI0039FD6FD2